LAQEAAAEERVTALEGADVYTVTRGVVRGGTVLVRGERIERVGLRVEIPEGATRVDLRGLRLYPGWIAASARGIGGQIRGKAADSLDPFDLSMELATASGVTSCYLESGGAFGFFFRGLRPLPSGGTTAVIRHTLGQLDGMVWFEPGAIEMTADWVGASPSKRQDVLEKFQKARAYLSAKKDYEQRKAAGKLKKDEKEPARPGDADVQVKLLSGETRARMQARTWSEIRAALDLVEAYPFRLTLIGAEEGWVRPEEISRAGVRCIIDPRSQLDPPRTSGRPGGSTIELAAILHRAGVKLAIVPPQAEIDTDGIAGRDLMTLPLAAAFAIRGGLSEQAALEGITIAAAEIVGIDEQVGSIEEGKQADLIVLDGDPFHYESFVLKSFVAGREVYDKDKAPFFRHIRPRPIRVTAPPPKAEAPAPASKPKGPE
jgi:imidazolonepropionase-like amidohydrolase